MPGLYVLFYCLYLLTFYLPPYLLSVPISLYLPQVMVACSLCMPLPSLKLEEEECLSQLMVTCALILTFGRGRNNGSTTSLTQHGRRAWPFHLHVLCLGLPCCQQHSAYVRVMACGKISASTCCITLPFPVSSFYLQTYSLYSVSSSGHILLYLLFYIPTFLLPTYYSSSFLSSVRSPISLTHVFCTSSYPLSIVH